MDYRVKERENLTWVRGQSAGPSSGEAGKISLVTIWLCSLLSSGVFRIESKWSQPLACQVALVVKNPPANAGDIRNVGFDSWVRKISWRRTWQPILLQYSCLENRMDRGAWWGTVLGVAKSRRWLKQLGMHTHEDKSSLCIPTLRFKSWDKSFGWSIKVLLLCQAKGATTV